MAEDNRSIKPRRPKRVVAHRRTLSNSSQIPFPSSSNNPPMAPGPVKMRASQSTFFEGSRDVRMSGPANFNSGQDHHHTVGNHNIVIHLHGESGIKHALGLGILQSERPIRLSRSNPTSGVNSPKVSPHSTGDFGQSPGEEVPKGTPVEDLRAPTTIANRHFETYYRHLLAKQRGFPLWIPEPNDVLPVEYRRRGIDIGDVGFFMENGSFVHLFNICVAKDHPINPISIPDDCLPSDPLGLQPSDVRESPVLGPSDYLASSVMKTNSSPLTFVSTDSEGAVLVVPNGSKSYDLQNSTAFIKYASANAKNWYQYAKQIFGSPAKNGDLRLVVGHDKATAWGLMSFSSLHELESFRFRLIPKPVDQSGEFYQWEYLENRQAEARYGPNVREIEGMRGSDETDGSMVALENQCLFARTLNITFHHDVWATLVAEGIGGSDPTDSLRSFEEHPSKAINDLLLKSRPDAKLAITQDWDWISVIQTTEHILPPYEILFARILETHAICECEGTIFLEAKPVNETIQVVPGDMQTHDDTSHMIEELERIRKEEEFKKKEADAKKKEAEVKRKVEATRKMELEANKKSEEAKKKEADLKKKEEQTRKREEKLKAEAAQTKKLQLEAKKAAEEAEEKQEQFRRLEEETKKKEELIREKELALLAREEELKRRESEARKKEEEARRKQEDKKEDEKKGQEEDAQLREAERRRQEALDDAFKHVAPEIRGQREWILRQAKYERQAEQIRRNQEERKRNDSYSAEAAWASAFPSFSPNTSSPGVANAPPKPNGASDSSPSWSTPPASAWLSSTPKPPSTPSSAANKPSPGTFASTPSSATNKPATGIFASGKPRMGSVSSGTYPAGSSSHAAAGISEAQWARFQENFIKEQQEKFRRELEKKEAERRMRSAGRPLSLEGVQDVFKQHERLYTRLSKIKDLTWNDFPWPLLIPPSTPDDISIDQVAAYIQSPWWPEKDKANAPSIDRIKEHIRRWHPDRFEISILPRVAENEREKVKLGAGNVVRHLSEVLRKENEISSIFRY